MLRRRDSAEWKIMFGVLKEECATAYDLAEVVGMSVGSVRRYLNEAKRDRLIYVAHWTRRTARNVGNYMPVYRAGNRPDTPKPAALSWAERQRRYKLRAMQRLCRSWEGVGGHARKR